MQTRLKSAVGRKPEQLGAKNASCSVGYEEMLNEPIKFCPPVHRGSDLQEQVDVPAGWVPAHAKHGRSADRHGHRLQPKI